MDEIKLWQKVLVEVELNVSKANFSTWFKDTFITKQQDGVVFVGVPNAFVKEWLSNKYHSFIFKTLRSLSPNIRSLEYTISKKPSGGERGAPQPAQNSQKTALPLDEFYVNKENNLNPRYTFETFVVGPFNELAHAASQAVINKPGLVYNPLFIYGNTGVGKTHLIQAVGNQLKKMNDHKRVYYMTSEKFSLDYINSVHSGKVNNFKEKYRQYDVLIMDDIQFFAGKDKSQEELFHLFNNLYDNNKQIIFSADKHPNTIDNLEDRLKSRFGAGMIVDIPAPDFESRLAILKNKAAQHNLALHKDIFDFLGEVITGNIRELEGVINSIFCQTQLKNKPLTLPEIKQLIQHTTQTRKMKSPKDIIKIVSEFYNIEEKSIYEKTRRKEVIKPRQLVMYILREDFNISYPSIGQKLGGRDHTTVIHSCEKIKGELMSNDELAQELNQIRSLIA